MRSFSTTTTSHHITSHLTSHLTAAHHITSHLASHHITAHISSHLSSHHITSHISSHHIKSHITSPQHLTTSHQTTSPHSRHITTTTAGRLSVAGAIFGKAGMMLEHHFWWHAQHLVLLECHFTWQAQHLVMLGRHFLWQAQHLVASLFVAAAAEFHENVGDSRSAKCCIFPKLNASPKRQFMVELCSDHCRIMFGSWSNHVRIMVEPSANANDASCGRCNIWRSWNDVGASLFLAGTAVGAFGMSLVVAGAAFREILGDSRSTKCGIFLKRVSKVRKVTSAKGRVRDDQFMFCSP